MLFGLPVKTRASCFVWTASVPTLEDTRFLHFSRLSSLPLFALVNPIIVIIFEEDKRATVKHHGQTHSPIPPPYIYFIVVKIVRTTCVHSNIVRDHKTFVFSFERSMTKGFRSEPSNTLKSLLQIIATESNKFNILRSTDSVEGPEGPLISNFDEGSCT